MVCGPGKAAGGFAKNDVRLLDAPGGELLLLNGV